jgi:ketosteroid isomerase-like protein
MDPLEIVGSAALALATGDLERHLSFVAQEVIWQVNEQPPRSGREGYRSIRAALELGGESIVGSEVAGVIAEGDSEVDVRVVAERHLPTPPPKPRRDDSFPSTAMYDTVYTVRSGRITRITLAAFSGPNRVSRYP